MSTDVKPPESGAPAPAQGEDLKNVKAEFDRKTTNLQKENELFRAQLAQLMGQLKGNEPAKPAATKVSVFDDEEAYAARIKAEAAAEIEAKIAAQQARTARYQAVSSGLVSEFPELSDAKSELMVKAQELFKGYSEEERNSPLAMKAAVYDAAEALDIRPVSKRSPKGNDSFTLGSGSGAGSLNRNTGKGDLTAEQEMMGRLLGIDTSKKEIRDRIANNHGRKGYGRYE